MTIHDLSGKALPDTRAKFKRFEVVMDSRVSDLAALKAFFAERRPFLLSLLDSTALLEHDSFTDMLWAVFHMADELQSRDDLGALPKSDLDHLSVDLLRAYRLLILEWIDYINYLNREYPYLYSLAVRKNPFSEVRDVIVHETA